MSIDLKREYIRSTLKEVTDQFTQTQHPYLFIKAPKSGQYHNLPDLIFFDPLAQLKIKIDCRHGHGPLKLTNLWTDFGKRDPRIIYGYTKNSYLVCRIFKCDTCFFFCLNGPNTAAANIQTRRLACHQAATRTQADWNSVCPRRNPGVGTAPG